MIDGRLVERGQTPIFSVVEGAVPDTRASLKLLIEKGADVNHRLNDFSGGGNILRYAVVHYGQYDVCSFLIDQGADPDTYKRAFLTKLTHLLAKANISPGYASPQQIADYHKLVEKLESMGESMEDARADLKMWRDPMISSEGKRRIQEKQAAANKAAWLARQAEKKKAAQAAESQNGSLKQ